MIRILFLVIVTTNLSCSLMSHQSKSAKDRIREKEISMQSVLDLSRSSYQKGCIDGIKSRFNYKTYGKNFDLCKKLSKDHQNVIRDILKQ